MRRFDWLAGVFALLAGGAAASLGACFSSATDDCTKYPENDVCKGFSSSTSSGSTSTGTTGTGGMPPVKCEGDPTTENDVDQCAVFVSAGATPTADAGALGT